VSGYVTKWYKKFVKGFYGVMWPSLEWLGTLQFGIRAIGSTLDSYGPETSMNRCVH
jgi:hypothetical protein